MLTSTIRLWYLRTLLRTIPHYLTLMLLGGIRKVTQLTSWLRGKGLVGKVRVYDLLNAGPRNRFVVGVHTPTIVHNCSYGAGPGKVCSALQLDGVDISYDAVKSMHAEYWNIFKDVKKYEQKLVSQWEKNGGWFLNGLGFPTCVAQDKLKDIMNRQVQGTGHTILTFLQRMIADDLAAEGIPYRPYVYDFHDEIILEVPNVHAKRTFEIMDAAFQKLNKALHSSETVVKFKGSGDVMWSLAEAKIEDYKSIWRETK